MAHYTSEEWVESAGHRPLRELPMEDLLLLHRGFLWANVQRDCADVHLKNVSGENIEGQAHPASLLYSHLFAWYSFLYSLIEASLDPGEGRSLDIRGVFRQEIDAMQNLLRQSRNAVFHVPRSGRDYADSRMMRLIADDATSGTKIRRVHGGFARLFFEEFEARG